MKNLENIFEKKENTCRGHWYTYRPSAYEGSRGEIVMKDVFTKLKTKSCEGCEHCGGIPDMIDAEISEGGGIPFPNNINYGDMVELVGVNDGRCYEDLYDEWHLEFVKTGKQR